MEAPSGSAALLSFDPEPLAHKTVALISARLSFIIMARTSKECTTTKDKI